MSASLMPEKKFETPLEKNPEKVPETLGKVNQNQERTICLSVEAGTIIVRNGEKYKTPTKSTFSFLEGTQFRSHPNSKEPLILIKDKNVPLGIKAIETTSLFLVTGTKLEMVTIEAEITLKKDETFYFLPDTKVNVPAGTTLMHNGVKFIKDDDLPMYLVTKN